MADTTTQRPLAPGQLVGLNTLSVLALIASLVFGIVALVNTAEDSMPLDVIAALSWWSGFTLTVAVVAFVGSLVLAGVRRMLAQAGFRV